jgi:hypothetical protein
MFQQNNSAEEQNEMIDLNNTSNIFEKEIISGDGNFRSLSVHHRVSLKSSSSGSECWRVLVSPSPSSRHRRGRKEKQRFDYSKESKMAE